MGLVARFDFMPRVALNVFQQVPKGLGSCAYFQEDESPCPFRK
jgi:hypothetical protein